MQEVSIIPRGNAGGYTKSRPETDDMTMSIGKANDTIVMSMGGRVAEELVLKEITSGASSDMQHATKIAHAMVYDWGMSKKIGFLSLGSSSQVFIGRDYQTKNDFSEKLASIADEEIMAILNSNYKRAKDILTEKINILHEMAKLLLARETIYKEEVDMIMAGKKTEEIIKTLEAREKAQKEKEENLRAERERNEKLQGFERKIAEGENLFKLGVITQADLENLKKEYESFKNSLTAQKDNSEKTENVEVVLEKKPVKTTEKKVSNVGKVEGEGKPKKTTSTRKTPAKKVTDETKNEVNLTQKKKIDKNDNEGNS